MTSNKICGATNLASNKIESVNKMLALFFISKVFECLLMPYLRSCMQVDYLIVGSGLAGLAFSYLAESNDKSYVVMDDSSQQSSTVAGGLYNPVILKRFTAVWKAEEQLAIALPYYDTLEEVLGIRIHHKLPVQRLFHSAAEQNTWFEATDRDNLKIYLSDQINYSAYKGVKSKFGFGRVLHTGRIDTPLLISSYRKWLFEKGNFLDDTLDYNQLEIGSESVKYGDIIAKRVIFTEGFGLKGNPFFNHLPLKGTKGELLTIHAPKLNIDFVLKSGVFLIPLGDHKYLVGATYEWEDKTNRPTEKGKQELVEKLNKVLDCDYEIVEHRAGIRPTVIDRKPLVGQHSEFKSLYVLNGLGTRGVMIAPYAAKNLFDHLERKTAIDPEMSIRRFD